MLLSNIMPSAIKFGIARHHGLRGEAMGLDFWEGRVIREAAADKDANNKSRFFPVENALADSGPSHE